MTTKARMYLDFDGVFNAPEPPYNDTKTFTVNVKDSAHLREVSTITYSPQVVQHIENIRTQYDVELVWLTSWNDDNHILSVAPYMAGLDKGRVIQANLNHAADNSHDWTIWKAEAILMDQTHHPTPFVWVDDNAPKYHGLRITNELKQTTQKIITPNSKTGLTQTDLDEIEHFFTHIL